MALTGGTVKHLTVGEDRDHWAETALPWGSGDPQSKIIGGAGLQALYKMMSAVPSVIKHQNIIITT